MDVPAGFQPALFLFCVCLVVDLFGNFLVGFIAFGHHKLLDGDRRALTLGLKLLKRFLS